MNAYKVEVQLKEDGQLALSGLPFTAGSMVEVIVLEQSHPGGSPNALLKLPKKQVAGEILEPASALQGIPQYRYDDPFEPAVPLEDWNVLS